MGAGTGIPNIGSSAIGDPIGKAVVEIIADDKEYQKGLKKSEKSLDLFDKKTQKIARRAGIAFAAGGAAITAALGAVIFQAAKAGDELDKMSLRTGVSVENLSRLGFAAKRSGADMNALETSLRFLARRMDESSQGIGIAKEVFDDLGVSITDQEGVLRSQPEVIKDVATAISNLESETKQVAAAMDIFGARSGPGLLPLLKQGEEGIQALMDRADELGIVISTEAATASAEFSDRLLEMTASLKMAGFELGQTLLPAAEKAVVAFTGVIAEFNKLDAGTKEVIGYTAAIAGLTASIIGPGLLVISRLDAITKGFKALNIASVGGGIAGVASTVGAAAAIMFAANQILKEMRDDTDELEGSLNGAEESSRAFSAAVKEIENAINDARLAGIDPTGKSLEELGANMDRVNGALQRWETLWEAGKRAITGTDKPIQALIPPTIEAEAAIDILGKAFDTAREDAEEFRSALDGANDGMDDTADAAGTAAAKLTGFQDALSETRKSLGFLSILAEKPIFPRVDPVLPKPGEAGILAANITAIIEAEKATAKLRKELEETRGETDFSFLTTERRLDDEETQLKKAQKRIENFNDAARREGEDRAGKTLEEFRVFLREQEKEKEAARKQGRKGFDKAKKDDEKSKAEQKKKDEKGRKDKQKADEKALKETLNAQAQAAADVLAAWERTRDGIVDVFTDLFDTVITDAKVDWQQFLNDLGRMFSRKFAEIAAEETVGRLLDRLAGQRTTGGSVAGTVGDVTKAKVESRIFDKILGPSTAATAVASGVGATGPLPAGAAATTPGVAAATAAASVALPVIAAAGIIHGGVRTIRSFLRHRELQRQVESGELEVSRRERNRRAFTANRSALTGREPSRFNEAAEARGEVVRIDQIVNHFNVPSDMRNMTQQELDELAPKLAPSIVRAANRDPRIKRGLR